MNFLSKILLSIPLLWFIYLWLTLVFHFKIDITPDWLFYDATARAGFHPKGLIPNDIFPFVFFILSPLMCLIATLYTALKKMWWWFTAYMGLAGLPILAFIIAGKFS